MNPPAYGARNGHKVVLGTGESLTGLGLAARERVLSITGEPGKWQTAGRQSEGVVVVGGRESRPHGEGPLLHRCTRP